MIQVYKFGGASIANPERMKALLPIIRQAEDSLVVVVSAYGKTTNAMEEVVWAVLRGERKTVIALLNNLEDAHLHYAEELLSKKAFKTCKPKIEGIFKNLYTNTESVKGRKPNFIYDYIVSCGELLSSTILEAFLNSKELPTQWVDARSVIRTNDRYREAVVQTADTEKLIQETIAPYLKEHKIVVTQGFIGATHEGEATTLGREGSDYTGALMASVLNADSLTIWKDVESLLNADPRKFEETIAIPETTFHEVIEMSYYGAQVIHPKTIKPLQNKNIPLYLKCFLSPKAPGTLIHNTDKEIKYPPIIVLKDDQVLLQITSRDYSFFSEGNLNKVYKAFNRYHIKINMTQNAAISVTFVVNNQPEKIAPLIKSLNEDFEVQQNNNQQLLTIRHYKENLIRELTKGRSVILTQKTPKTIQMVMA